MVRVTHYIVHRDSEIEKWICGNEKNFRLNWFFCIWIMCVVGTRHHTLSAISVFLLLLVRFFLVNNNCVYILCDSCYSRAANCELHHVAALIVCVHECSVTMEPKVFCTRNKTQKKKLITFETFHFIQFV